MLVLNDSQQKSAQIGFIVFVVMMMTIACGTVEGVAAPGDGESPPISTAIATQTANPDSTVTDVEATVELTPKSATSVPRPTLTPMPPRPEYFGNWTTVDGSRVPLNALHTYAGPGHCDLEEITIMILALPLGNLGETGRTSAQYIKDELGVLTEPGSRDDLDGFESGIELPNAAEFSGYISGDMELWTIEAEMDSWIFVVEGEYVEKWPRIDPKIVCY
ncbi:hypothetical protein JYU04_01665 [Dehalococcoides mccartyi]|nr:hypothetical protein [Dehalococcoides mccartyi]